jgi:choline dehydrogenase-like flavoprotein
MIYDLNSSSFDELNYDLVIIGSGPAGLSLAYKLLGNDFKVAVIEGGGKNYSTESLETYKGQVIGDKYFDLQFSRQRFFGGTSNHWTGWCRPLDAHDFEYKDHQKNASWPIKRLDLEPYFDEASKILEINTEYDDELLNSEFGVKKISFNFSPPVRFGKKYENIFIGNNLDLFLNSNLVNFTKMGSSIDTGTFRSFNSNSFQIKSKTFVLATGGIENSRLMLALNQKNNNKLFRKEMPIGKYWMEHPHFTIGESIVPLGWENRFLALTSSKQKELGILNCGIRFEAMNKKALKQLIADVACYAPETGKKLFKMMERNLVCGAKIRAAWEQAPNKNNKITLSKTEKDIFGIPRPILHYKKTDFDKNTVYKTIKQIASYGNSLSYGKIKVFDYVSSLGVYPQEDELAGYHHMGGTRMSDSNQDGVVDKNLKVHGINNFFIAGSSVFPSGGHANPTLTITQLSLRLGDHIKNILK